MSKALKKALDDAIALKHAKPPQDEAYQKAIEKVLEERRKAEEKERAKKRGG